MNDVKTIPAFSLTKSAAERIAQLLQTETGPYFRVQVDGGGCSGFQYKFEFESKKQDDDLELKQHGVSVLIDEMPMPFLEQAQLDYKEELIGSSFSITNPNAKNSCGCGTSFSI